MLDFLALQPWRRYKDILVPQTFTDSMLLSDEYYQGCEQL